MSPLPANKQARAADTSTFPLFFLDTSGTGVGPFVPAHITTDALGNFVTPALDSSLGTDGTTPPTLPGGSTGVRGWLRYIGSLLSGTLTVSQTLGGNALSPTNRLPVEIDADSVTLPVSAVTLPLPTGASKESGGNLDTLAGAVSNGVMKTADASNAAFATATALTAGSTYTAGRSVGINCTTAGNITLTTSGGSAITLPISVGWNTYPFAVTSFSWPASGAGAGSVYNLN